MGCGALSPVQTWGSSPASSEKYDFFFITLLQQPHSCPPSTTRADRASLGFAHTNSCVTDPKGGSLAGLGGHLAKHLARALQVIHFFPEFILRWAVIHPEWE